jgi:hypothetical protein
LGLWLFLKNFFLESLAFGGATHGGCSLESLVAKILGRGVQGQKANHQATLNIKFCGLLRPEFHTRNIPPVRRIFM